MAGTQEGEKKAVETRKEHDHEAFSKMGEKVSEERHDKSAEQDPENVFDSEVGVEDEETD